MRKSREGIHKVWVPRGRYLMKLLSRVLPGAEGAEIKVGQHETTTQLFEPMLSYQSIVGLQEGLIKEERPQAERSC
mgnify:CR=1 FL=1